MSKATELRLLTVAFTWSQVSATDPQYAQSRSIKNLTELNNRFAYRLVLVDIARSNCRRECVIFIVVVRLAMIE